MQTNKEFKKKIFSSFFWKFSERIFAQLISLIVSIILARLLSPSDYGAVALVMVFITLADVFVSSGFGNALIQKKNVDNLDFSSVFFINIIWSLILYFILYCTSPIISNFYNMPIIDPVLKVLALRIPIAGINSVQQAYVSRHMLFKRFFWSTLLGTLISGIVGVVMAYHSFGVWSLVAQYLTNTCIDTIVLWLTVKWRPEFKCSWNRASKLISYGWKLLVSGLIDTGYRQVRSLIIGKKYNSTDLAFYNQGDKYPALVVVNINTSISSVLFPAMSLYQDNNEKVKQMTRRSIQVSAYIMWPIMIGLGVIAEPLIRILLTDKWLQCVPYLRIFCFTYGLWPIHTANLQAIKAVGRSDLFLKLEIAKKGVGIIAMIISMQISPLAMAFSLVLADIISIFINALPNTKILTYKFDEQFRDFLPPLFLALIMAIIIYPISLLKLSDIYTILIQIVGGGCIYLIGSIITKQPALIYLKKLVKQ